MPAMHWVPAAQQAEDDALQLGPVSGQHVPGPPPRGRLHVYLQTTNQAIGRPNLSLERTRGAGDLAEHKRRSVPLT